MTIERGNPRPYMFAIVAGALATLLLLLVLIFTHQGLLAFLPYAALLVSFVVYLRRNRIAFRERFGASLTAYALPSVASFAYVIFVVNPIVLQHPWVIARIVGLMILVGLLTGVVLATVTAPARVAA